MFSLIQVRMTFTDSKKQAPLLLKIKKDKSKSKLIVHGQGIVIFHASSSSLTPCKLIFSNTDDTAGLEVSFTDTNVVVHLKPSDEPILDPHNSKGLTTLNGAYYWFSLDSQNQRLYAGIGEARIENRIFEYAFSPKTNIITKSFLESLVQVRGELLEIDTLIRDPIGKTIPLLVKNTEELTMDAIAENRYMPKSNLSLTSQQLYDCISGKNFILNTPDFPEFTKAIEHSIATPGLWCHERLKQKATEFNKDKPDYKETYLRITLGENNGESPGIPYVMEIWPAGHYSPIHNHGDSDAIIRVLNGTIQVSLYPFLSTDPILPFAKVNFKKDDITWISPTLNQVHQLKNLEGNKDTCITIQCYMYESTNKDHYDYFDYIDSDNVNRPYEPDSDMDFVEFKKQMKKEWAEQKWLRFFCLI
jgi:hypothetical protein